jgi:hypothetical protein
MTLQSTKFEGITIFLSALDTQGCEAGILSCNWLLLDLIVTVFISRFCQIVEIFINWITYRHDKLKCGVVLGQTTGLRVSVWELVTWAAPTT